MKQFILVLFIFFGSFFNLNAQDKKPVSVFVNEKGDTLIQFNNLSDAKLILGDLLDKEVMDRLLNKYENKDQIKTAIIILQTKEIRNLQKENENIKLILTNYKLIELNNGKEITQLKKDIKDRDKKIRNLKIFNRIGYSLAIALPIITLILATK